ncbi:putative septum site-determining protein MinC [Agrobacterium rubi TR3 = NBRC 13261]|uniref:Probable septum site-determining protein MinC n=2 Tax=Agrobacterium rubi TaxID=28099 RepID=A0A081CSV1_9HYPH|nr:putative septum site-determining protein MinC [Agrobacterium rubi TR3 = NBRC 13261]
MRYLIVNDLFTKMTKVLTDTSRSIRIKGRSFLAVVLSPEQPLDQWLERLDDLAARSAGFFLSRAVVLDVADLKLDKAGLKGLIAELVSRNVAIMGIEGARPSMIEAGMPPALKGGKAASDIEVEPVSLATAEVEEEPVRVPVTEIRSTVQSLMISEPVRSGQSVIFPEGDVTVVGSVASGAEIIAGGSIHIYGALRGRAMAGSLGNASARIFCKKLEAELLAIDGVYKVAEDIDPKLRGQAVQLWLENDTIKAEKLN